MEIRNIKNSNNIGVFATKKYNKDDLIYTLTGKIHDKQIEGTICVGNNMYICDKEYGMYINHSIDPNITIHNKEIFALHDININDELVFNFDNEKLEKYFLPDFGKTIHFTLPPLHMINHYNFITQTVELPKTSNELLEKIKI